MGYLPYRLVQDFFHEQNQSSRVSTNQDRTWEANQLELSDAKAAKGSQWNYIWFSFASLGISSLWGSMILACRGVSLSLSLSTVCIYLFICLFIHLLLLFIYFYLWYVSRWFFGLCMLFLYLHIYILYPDLHAYHIDRFPLHWGLKQMTVRRVHVTITGTTAGESNKILRSLDKLLGVWFWIMFMSVSI